MRGRPTSGPSVGRRTGAILLATAVVSMLLVVATSSTTTSAAPVNATIPTSCTGRDKTTNDTLSLAMGPIGSDRVAVDLVATGRQAHDRRHRLRRLIDAGHTPGTRVPMTGAAAAAPRRRSSLPRCHTHWR